MKAKILKETEKAIQLTFGCEIYGEHFTVKSAWFPKSQIEITSNIDGKIEFMPKNDWILNAKVREYCQYIAETFPNVKTEIKLYLSGANNYKVDYCYA